MCESYLNCVVFRLELETILNFSFNNFFSAIFLNFHCFFLLQCACTFAVNCNCQAIWSIASYPHVYWLRLKLPSERLIFDNYNLQSLNAKQKPTQPCAYIHQFIAHGQLERLGLYIIFHFYDLLKYSHNLMFFDRMGNDSNWKF